MAATTLVALGLVAGGAGAGERHQDRQRADTQLAASFDNPNFIEIRDSGPANPYPSEIFVRDLGDVLVDVNVKLFGLQHTNPIDLDVVLVGPQGQAVILMSDAGGTGDVTDLSLTFDGALSRTLPENEPLPSGTGYPVRPTNYGAGDTFPGLPEIRPTTSLERFDGTNPNGSWKLYVYDDAVFDSGIILRGWRLDITSVNSSDQNEAPQAANDRYQAKAGKTLRRGAPGVLGNDRDPDGDRLVAQLVAAPRNGKLSLNPDGSFSYTPKGGFTGTDTLTYKATDEAGASDTATVKINVAKAKRRK